ncbi:glycerol-3-phosphate 1-O-acyltransferase PlsY [Desulfocurvus sp.]|jgi:glycerol-3-phosphate acyltransferase PlsY|uniref:glycerol-3-phosphate 1-O-acyltransferase PlsY n=1 Tax=Desulfocurvus sp. TaxID=2871698 RepID=UPI0025B87EB6|nr:glycerol-3-phosphate 1-O-acyltransferase PlsY [Desulfocurvus sp.]MCK9241011.1 glycerol-3-phosphate 1-O-acyltransferase PlsY [Desulfocurvus sp.]
MLTIGWIAFSYLLGAVPFGLLVGRVLCGVDPRTAGSRNTGATNIARLCGFKYGVLALALDLGKGLAPVALARTFTDSPLFLALAAGAAITGHCYSVFLRGKGGKAVATTIGAFVALAFWPTLISCALCVAVIARSGFVSLGSLTLAAALPVCMLLSGRLTYAVLGVVVMALIFWRHRDNIRRLARGEEKPWRRKDAQPGQPEQPDRED